MSANVPVLQNSPDLSTHKLHAMGEIKHKETSCVMAVAQGKQPKSKVFIRFGWVKMEMAGVNTHP